MFLAYNIHPEIYLRPPDCKSPLSPLLHGMGLDLSFAAAERKHDADCDAKGVQEEMILVVFEFSDGSQAEAPFRLGQTVEYLKSYIESEYGIPMQEQNLLLDGKAMMDPLSLLDFTVGAKGN